MNLVLAGLSHKTAPVSIREKIAFRPEQLPEAFRVFRAIPEIREHVILSTCNRTEIYAVTVPGKVNGLLPECLAKCRNIPPQVFKNHLYIKEGLEAAQHLFYVTAGLDSLVLGEEQILGQVKQHFRLAQDAKSSGLMLHRLFQSAIEAGKRIRHETALGENPSSVGEAALTLARQIFGSLEGKRLLIIGMGKMGRLIAETLAATGVSNPVMITHSPEKAQEFARSVQGAVHSFEEMGEPLLKADIVIAASGRGGPVLTRSKLEFMMRERKHSPLFIIDIAVPRDVEEGAGQLDNLYLYNIDDLQRIVEEAGTALHKEISKARTILDEEILKFSAWVESRRVVPTLCALQHKFEQIQAGEVQKLLAKFPDLSEREQAGIRQWAHTLVNKILHGPFVRLKSCNGHPLGPEYLDVIRHLFDLEDFHD